MQVNTIYAHPRLLISVQRMIRWKGNYHEDQSTAGATLQGILEKANDVWLWSDMRLVSSEVDENGEEGLTIVLNFESKKKK